MRYFDGYASASMTKQVGIALYDNPKSWNETPQYALHAQEDTQTASSELLNNSFSISNALAVFI